MRAFNRVLSAVLAAALVVAGVLTVLEICRAALNQPPAVIQWPGLLQRLLDNTYRDPGPLLICCGLVGVGLLLVVSGLRRGRPYALPAGTHAPGVRTEINRRSLQRAMRAAAVGSDRVAGGSVTLHRRSARVVVQSRTASTDGLEEEARERLEQLLAGIAITEAPRLRIKAYAASGASDRAAAAAPRPGPAPAPEREPEPELEPEPAPAPAPDPEPAPAPVPEPEPAPVPERAPEPEPEPAPETNGLDDLLGRHPDEDGEPR